MFLRAGFVAAATFVVLTGGRSHIIQAQSSCGPTTNPIVCENQKPGDPSSLWDVSGSGDSTIQGFATSISVTPGQTESFKINTSSNNYTIDIYRMGYYGGRGARKVASVTPVSNQNQPNCLTDGATGLVDCGNWAVSANWVVPADAVSGIYFAHLTRIDTGGESHIVFIVRESDTASHHSDVVFQTSDTTWQAYNTYGGNSLYVGGPGNNPGRAYKVSYNRPFTTRGTGAQDFVFNAEYPMVRWLEANGYDVSYITGVDTDRSGPTILTPSKHKTFMSVGHDEYWSGPQRTNVEAARAAGVHLAFFSGNEVFWKTRWENSIDGTNTPYRTLVTYKETHANARLDPADPPTWTGTWRDPRFSPPADGGRPENALTGTIFKVNSGDTAIAVPAALGKTRFWRNTSVATLAAGATATMPQGTVGYEWDEEANNGFRPAGLMHLSSTTASGVQILLDYGSTYGTGTATHNLTLYRHSSGALVFGAGTVQWSWGLDANHDRGSAAADVRMQQATVNLFADMGLQPGSLQSGLSPASASSDTTPPTSTIASPASGASISAGTIVTISGTASDAGGGTVAGVEISTDGGTTWSQATGTTSWTYQWTPVVLGSATIKSRAFDDTGNMETPSGGATVTITGSTRTCPCTIWPSTATPQNADDGDTSSTELGVRFRSNTAGFITGIRFYKGTTLNGGTHVGSLWTNSGSLLGSVTFTNETSTGWQQANFGSAIAIAANTTYVVSYHAPSGHYSSSGGYFATTGFSNAPLSALQDGVDGANGVYAYSGSSTFPSQTYLSELDWVDVVFNTSLGPDTTPPTVTSVFPFSGATGVDPATAITATFSEAMDPATISSSTTGSEGGGSSFGTFELHDSSNNLVTATVTYDATSHVATLRPNAALALSTLYTALVKGGTVDPRVKDLAGNAMTANYTWSFTIAATPPPPSSCPCSIWPASTVPQKVDDGDTSSTELGTRFRSDVAGFVTGARFYKSALNTGTHVAKLWTNTGTLLGSATFAGESSTGWQQVAFATPIAVSANTTYLISYHAPSGHYSSASQVFATTSVDAPPLHALKNGADGANGVYLYGTSAFPTQTFQSEAYFIDVVFNTSAGPDTTPPTVTAISPGDGAAGMSTTTSVTAVFSEPLNATTVTSATVFLTDPSNAVVPTTLTFTAATNTATLSVPAPLAYSTTYKATVKGGASGVKDVAGNPMTNDRTWSFSTSAPPPPPPTQGPGGPVLVVTAAANPFSVYYAEILRSEGVNAFATLDISQVTASTLSAYDVVILGQTPLTAAQVSMFTTWVNGGGNLVAMRPDKQLAGLLGLTDAASTLTNGYVLVNTASSPGAGIVNQTIQFHGIADRYTTNGATTLATLYSSATTATTNPAVTTRTVGSGHAVAFTYDLAKSVIYTRQGNPAWSGQERDGLPPIRSDDLFFGAKTGDVQPDWVDLSKVAVPQADEQQRFLWNIMLSVNANKKPLPRFWYFPRMFKAAVVMTGDDHANGGTAGRFDTFIADSPAGCSVANWECIRGTSYIYAGTPISNAQVSAYIAQGFEIALHAWSSGNAAGASTGSSACNDFTPTSITKDYSLQLSTFASLWPAATPVRTNRTHCITWSDYATQPQVQLSNGIRLDTTYYFYPPTWVNNVPGLFTGSGMPQRFADLSGNMIDVYQATSQMTDESLQTYPKTIDALLTNAVGPLGYYGAFTANMHTDFNPSDGSLGADAIVASAQARGVPVVSALQMLNWLDGRNGSSFQSMTWNGSQLAFTVAVGAGANGLQTLVPNTFNGSPISGITLNGTGVAYTVQPIKGVDYAVFTAQAGPYQVNYGADVAPPTISAIASSASTNSATITWTTNEASDSRVDYGTNSASLTSSSSNSALVTSHSIPLSNLQPGTTYFYRVTSADAAHNATTSPAIGNPASSFATPLALLSGTISPASSGNGATLTLSGAATATVTADASGNYLFSGLANGTYTVTPSKTGFSFSPAGQSVTVNGTSVTGVNFTAQTITLSGTISGGAGVTVTLSGAVSAGTTADASGNYTFSGLANGAYTVTPSRSGFTFTPTSQTVTISGASVGGVNFTAQTVTISGTITGTTGVTVTLTGGATTTTDGSGNYTFSGLTNGAYTVTPSKNGYSFSPASQSVTISGVSVGGVNFTAQPVVVSGTITGTTGVTVTLTGGATTTTDASGNFAFSAVANGTYTVTPSKSAFTFTPANQSVTISGASVGGVNFTATPIPTFSISGTITPAASGNGATMTLSGAASATVLADSSGNYSFSGLLNGLYTVTPSKSGFVFTPASQSVTVNGANVIGINFTAQTAVAITIDATTSTDSSNKATTIATSTFSTTSGNELLLAFVSADNDGGTNTTVTGVAATGLTWQLVQRTNVQVGTAEIWRAFASAALTNVTVTATLSQSNAASITVMSFKGVNASGTNGSGAIGATGSGSASAGAPTASLTTTRANSMVLGVGVDWDSAVARTLGSSQTLVHQYLATIGDTYWVQRTTSTVPAAGTVVTINDTAPTSDRYNLSIVEIVP